MKFSMRTYTAYSIACVVVWAVLLAIVGFTGSHEKKHIILYVLLGWVIGWLSATIARFVYPPPKSRMSVDAAA
jgi:membrane protein DedA with SNARE-associated domain